MIVKEFRAKIKPGIKLSVEDKDFLVKQVVKFRFDDGSYYVKCWLENGYVFADDAENNIFILVKEVKTSFTEPFHKKMEYENKKFNFLYKAHAVAEEVYGAELADGGFGKGEGEAFWDYKSQDNSYLSLGVNDKTGKRQDFYGKIVNSDLVKIYGAEL